MRFILLLFVLVFSGSAFSQDFSQCTNLTANIAYCHTESQARRYARLSANNYARRSPNYSVCPRDYHDSPSKRYNVRVIDTSGGNSDCNYYVAVFSRVYIGSHADHVCPPGSGPKPGFPGQCLTSEDCLAKNTEGKMGGVRAWANRCLANGCEVAFDPNAADYVKTTIGNKTMFSGTIEYTGKVCTAPDQWAPEQPDTPKPPELPPEQEQPPTEECTPLPHGQTACVKRNGDVCATASTGRQICWKPGETGRKTDKNVVQDKKPGDRTMPPSISIDNGDTADKSRDDIKIKEEFAGGRSSTTTIGTYETNSGANAGSSNQGSNSGGSGSSNGQDGGQDGGKDGGKGTYSGGETCDSPPVSTGDAQLAGIIHQQWLERCGEGAGLEVDVDTDPSSVFPNPSEGVGFDTRSIDSLGLDSSGFIGGGGSCPALADAGGSGKLSGAFATYLVSPPAWWCNLVAAIHYVMMALGAIASVYIMAGRKN